MRLQNKKNLRQRMNRLHTSVNKIVSYGIGLEHQGSLKKGTGPVEAKKDGTYDLDVDFVIKTDDSAFTVRTEIEKGIKQCLRSHETMVNLKRVIRINVDEDGNKYNFDVAIKNFNTETAIHEVGVYKWVK